MLKSVRANRFHFLFATLITFSLLISGYPTASATVISPHHVYAGTTYENNQQKVITGQFSVPASQRAFDFTCYAKAYKEADPINAEFCIQKQTTKGNVIVFQRTKNNDNWIADLAKLELGEGNYILTILGKPEAFALLEYKLEDAPPAMPNYQRLGEYQGILYYVNQEWSSTTQDTLDVWLKLLPTPESKISFQSAAYLIVHGTFKTDHSWTEQKRLYFSSQNQLLQSLPGSATPSNDPIKEGCKTVLEKYFTLNQVQFTQFTKGK